MGSEAVAHAARLARAAVISAYPITPQTHIVEDLADMCADGRLNARFVMVESEHSAMACLVGASTAGSRVFTATSSHGLVLMHEVLHWASGARLPIVMANVNRALGPPWTILCDHGDSMAQRDTGWIQFYAETNQEIVDTVIQAYRIAEQVLMPVMVNLDGFFLSHTAEVVDIPDQDMVDNFLPPFAPPYKLDVSDPRTFGAVCLDANLYMKFKRNVQMAMNAARRVAEETDAAFGEVFGRRYGLLEPYRLEGAEIVLVTAGTIAGTTRVVVDRMREDGVPVGLVRIRMVRPFAFDLVREYLGQAQRVAVIDRSISYGLSGGLATEIRAALYGRENGRPPVFGYIAGIGGKDLLPSDIENVVHQTLARKMPPSEDIWIGVES